MNKLRKSIALIFVGALIASCGSFTPVPAVAVTETLLTGQTAVTLIPTNPQITLAPTFNSRTFIITPDGLFSFPDVKLLNTPNSKYFCEHIPLPQVVESTSDVSLIVGKFSLCVSRSWPWIDTAIDLDAGKLVSTNDENGDFAMDYTHPDLDGNASYALWAMNNTHIDEIDTAKLSYKHCESIFLALNKPGIVHVHDGAIACVLTTDGQIALIRVEKIYPLDTQVVEFSFAILK